MHQYCRIPDKQRTEPYPRLACHWLRSSADSWDDLAEFRPASVGRGTCSGGCWWIPEKKRSHLKVSFFFFKTPTAIGSSSPGTTIMPPFSQMILTGAPFASKVGWAGGLPVNMVVFPFGPLPLISNLISDETNLRNYKITCRKRGLVSNSSKIKSIQIITLVNSIKFSLFSESMRLWTKKKSRK